MYSQDVQCDIDTVDDGTHTFQSRIFSGNSVQDPDPVIQTEEHVWIFFDIQVI